ncbi:MAG TPA: hypothetical protein VE987_01700 [Polyangiaceae bacterium]|nr:hypothetical protein [Polyangiaceae bacterium]
MRIPSLVAASAVLLSVASNAREASAFGGTARELERQGNFVVRNNATFAFQQQVNSPTHTSFVLGPAIDYFVIENLSVGGRVQFEFNSPSIFDSRDQNSTRFTVAPDVGYEVALSDTFSLWPQASLALQVPSKGNDVLTLVLSVPFLVHPAEHFFFGVGPDFAQDLTANANTFIGADFTIGGYFDH